VSDPDRLAQAIDAQEGFEPNPYQDTQNLWTIGTGRCLETHPFTGPEWKKLLDNHWLNVALTTAGASWLRDMELADVEAHLSAAFSWWGTLNDARQNALIEMAYQMGFQKLLGFHLMLAAIARGDWTEVANQALNSDWARETPARARAVAQQLASGAFA